MLRTKITLPLVMVFVIFLSACAAGIPNTLPVDMTFAQDAGTPQQVTLSTPDTLIQTTIPEIPTPVPSATTSTFSSSGLKPPDSDTPAAGICGEAQGDPVSIVLGIGTDGIPLAGRCLIINPAQRIKLINQSNGPFNILFGEYHIEMPVGNEMLLEKPVGQYLALGVHSLPMGPELWVKEAVIATAPSSITYEVTMADNGKTFNIKVGDRLRLNLDPFYDWSVSVDNPTVIAGLTGLYHGLAAGTASLSAVGNPKCYSSTPPCLAPSIMFKITAVVQ
jgi:hypothetical protein